MSTGTKAKTFDITDAACIELARAIISNDYRGEDAHVDLGTCNTVTLCASLERIEGKVRKAIDGAPIPLPADVRRVLRLVMREYRHAQTDSDVAAIKAGRQGDLWAACEQHERAEKRRNWNAK